MPRRRTRGHRGTETMWRSLEHQLSFVASEAGRRAVSLRDEGQALQRIGRHDQAFVLFRQAVDCFAPEDEGAAAAAAWHDLGEGFRLRQAGSRLENLREAERWLRRALACPARAEDPRRRALTLNSLASTLRMLAEVGHGQALLEEAKHLLTEAVAVSEGFGPMFLHERARFLDTLGNLHLQLGELKEALHLNRRAVAAARERLLLVPDDREARRTWVMFKCHLVRRLVLRGRRTDLREALEIAAELHREGPDDLVDEVGLCEALTGRALGSPNDIGRARAALEATRIEGIAPEHRAEYVDLLAELGRRDLAIDHTRNELHAAMTERIDAKSDYLADHASHRARVAGRRLARLYLDADDPLAAFLALENTSGLRYEDALREYAVVPSTLYGRALDELEASFRIHSALVDDMAGVLAHLDTDGQQRLLTTLLEQPPAPMIQHGPSDTVDRARDRITRELLPAALARARTGDPVAILRAFADDLAQRAARVKAELRGHEPGLDTHPGGLGTAVDAEDLRALLGAGEGTVFLRLSLSRTDLIAVAVALVDGSPRATGRVLPVDPALLRTTREAASAIARLHEGARPEDVALFRCFNDALSAIDLSALFPAGAETLVILPDQRAAMLPLAALGPRGSTPLERFASVTWLPCLGPRRCRQVAMRPRHGMVTLAPNPKTQAATALTPPLPGETIVWGAAATIERLLATITTADVVCLYTHGEHGGHRWPSFTLADGQYEMLPMQGGGWIGIERVEIWACESAVDLPSDPRGVATNEFFGLDGMLLHNGVRSTIGTLWPVLDRVTAGIVAQYRRLLANGERADRALAAAQRWWLRDGAPAFLARAPNPDELRPIVESPALWAGYRFAGVCERRPLRDASAEGRLSAAEEAAIESLLVALDGRDEPLDAAIESALTALDDEVGSAAPSAAQALRATRLYRVRPLSAHVHNQLCALAWLHEADRVAPAEDRPALVREAARLWLWLSLFETPEAPFIAMQGPTPARQAAMQRAQRLLVRLPADTYAPEAAMLRTLAAAERGDRPLLADVVRDTCARHSASAPGLDLGALAILCWIASQDVDAAGEHAGRLIMAIGSHIDELSTEPERLADTGLLAWTGLLLTRALGRPPPVAGIPWRLLPAPMLCAGSVSRLRALSARPETGGSESLKEISEALTELEGRLWDHPQRNGEDLWRSTGSTGAAYRRLAGWYLRGVAAHEQPERYATVFAACLQYFADLRLLVRNRLAHILHSAPAAARPMLGVFADLDELLAQAERRTGALEAVALLPDVEGQRRLLDPFELSPDVVRHGFASLADAPAWELAQLAGTAADDPRTLAFQVVRALETRRRRAFRVWRDLGDLVPSAEHWRLIHPVSDVEANQRVLAELPQGTCLLSCTITPSQEVLMTTLARDRAGLRRRVSLRGQGVGLELRRLVVLLLRPQPEELDGDRGPARSRAAAWMAVHELLAPQLAECLPPTGEGMRLAVFAPGCLRGLPWSRLPPLAHFLGVWQIPTLGWWPSRPPPPDLACWLELMDAPASTAFGEAVIAGLRAASPPRMVIGGAADPQREIPEVQQVERAADLGLRRLRYYGHGIAVGITDAVAGLQLGGERAFVDRNLAGTRFVPGTEVELWAATPSLGDCGRAVLDHGDRLPGLVHSLLGAGAIAVLDLAWPVHDFVKAMVCQHFSLLRGTRSIEGAVALTSALRWCATLIAKLLIQKHEFADAQAVLTFVDVERQQTARELGNDPAALVPLPPAEWPGGTTAWLDEIGSPSHLAAFRWWGACDLGPVKDLVA